MSEQGEGPVVFHFGLTMKGGRQRRAAQSLSGRISNIAIRSPWGSGLAILSGRSAAEKLCVWPPTSWRR
eukprot:755174-Hanusia_phi.AAC.3